MLAIAALLAFSATAEAASEYDYGGREKYKHEYHGSYKPSFDLHGAYRSEHMRGDSDYEEYSHEPSYESRYEDRDYREPYHDSYDEDHYGRDAYSGEQSYSYMRSRRSPDDEKSEVKVRTEMSAQGEGGARESLKSCCFCTDKVRVLAISGSGEVGPIKVHDDIFTDYKMGKFTVHEKDHWVSKDGKKAIWSKGGSWFIGDESLIGTTISDANINSKAKCVHDSENAWKYWVADIGQWIDAKGGLTVRPI